MDASLTADEKISPDPIKAFAQERREQGEKLLAAVVKIEMAPAAQ